MQCFNVSHRERFFPGWRAGASDRFVKFKNDLNLANSPPDTLTKYSIERKQGTELYEESELSLLSF